MWHYECSVANQSENQRRGDDGVAALFFSVCLLSLSSSTILMSHYTPLHTQATCRRDKSWSETHMETNNSRKKMFLSRKGTKYFFTWVAWVLHGALPCIQKCRLTCFRLLVFFVCFDVSFFFPLSLFSFDSLCVEQRRKKVVFTSFSLLFRFDSSTMFQLEIAFAYLLIFFNGCQRSPLLRK